MLLRSSSAPVFGILQPPFSDTHKREFDVLGSNPPYAADYNSSKLPFSHGFPALKFSNRKESYRLRLQAFRRAQSDGNLEGLVHASCDPDKFHDSDSTRKCPFKHQQSLIPTSPSFSVFNLEAEDDATDKEKMKRTVTIGDRIDALACGADFSFMKKDMELIEEEGQGIFSFVEEEEEDRPPSPPMYLAAGLGIDAAAGFAGGRKDRENFFSSFDDGWDAEKYYKKMVHGFPCHPLVLRNYARLLQCKGDLKGAEEYYSRAILSDPWDGELLSSYAKLLWELHRDHERAGCYFERSVQANPEDSHVLGAYASFLWEAEDDDNEENAGETQFPVPPLDGAVSA